MQSPGEEEASRASLALSNEPGGTGDFVACRFLGNKAAGVFAADCS
jgi:hypothetical protein